ncbi:MAG: glycosyltransferase family 2 protein [Planctomycetota bacterium]
MTPPLRVSVLISCFNYGRYIEETVASVLAQERPVDQVIVIDDGSTDDTPAYTEKAKALDPRVMVERTENRGQLAAMIRGIELANADVVCFMDADDLYKPGHTRSFAEAFERHPQVDYVYGDYEQFGDRTGVRRSFQAGRDHDHGRTALLAKYGLRTYGGVASTTAARRELLLPLLEMPDAWLSDWKVAADLAMNYFVSLAGGRKLYRFGDTVRYRVHGGNDHLAQAKLADSNWRMRRLRASRWVEQVSGLVCPGDALLGFIDREAKTIPRLSGVEYRNLVKTVARSPLSTYTQAMMLASLTGQRLKSMLGRRAVPDG